MSFTVILILLLVCAFLSGIEISLTQADRLRIELEIQKKTWRGRYLAQAFNNPTHWFGTTLVVFNAVLAALTIGMIGWLHEVPYTHFNIHNIYFIELLDISIVTVVVLVFIESIPKTIFQIAPTQTLLLLSYPVYVLQLLFAPIVHFFINVSRWIVRLMGYDIPRQHTNVFTKRDLEQFLENINRHTDIDQTIFHNALEINEVMVRDCMIKRPQIHALDVNESIDTLRKRFVELQITRLLLYDGELDNVIGYFHNHYLLQNPQTIREYVFPIIKVIETTPVHDILHQMIKEQRSLVAIVDDMGKLAGLASLHEILGVIFGNIDEKLTTKPTTPTL